MRGRVITFYSYKGGVGRTLALANVAVLLAQWGYRVLCVDWDLEAPGLHAYFRQLRPNIGEDGPGLVELVKAYADGGRADYRSHVVEIRAPEVKGILHCMPAGRLDDSYVRRLQEIDWERLHLTHDLGNYLEELRERWISDYDFVLVDSRTGITDIGGICTIQLPDELVLLFTANRQSVEGALDVARRASAAREKLPFDRSKLLILPVAMRFEDRTEYANSKDWRERFAKLLAPTFAEWAGEHVAPQDVLRFTKTPYVAFWSFGEPLPVIEEGTLEPGSLSYSLETLAAILAHRFAGTEMLVENRDSYVGAARRRLPPEAPGGLERLTEGPVRPRASAESEGPPLVYISHASVDNKYARRLAVHLKPLVESGQARIWLDEEEIALGESIAAAVRRALEEAALIVVLMSPEALSSRWIDEEIQTAVQRGARVLPVLVRPALVQGSTLAQYLVLPRDGRPISALPDPDVGWSQVVSGIRQILDRTRSSPKATGSV